MDGDTDCTMRVYPGNPYPLGATWDGLGVNFALFSERAARVELCLFDSVDATEERCRIPLTEYTHQIWHCYLPDVRPGQLYGYRVYGPYQPEQGLRFNANKVLLDPYAKAVARTETNPTYSTLDIPEETAPAPTGKTLASHLNVPPGSRQERTVRRGSHLQYGSGRSPFIAEQYRESPLPGRHQPFSDSLYGYELEHPLKDLSFNARNNAAYAPLGVVVDTAFTWGDDKRPNIPWHHTVIYEAHVKGLTMLHPEVPEPLRGTYAGLACRPVVDHLKKLGVTAIELLPVHQHWDEQFLRKKGLTNYWGYNTLSYFAPDVRFCCSNNPLDAVQEFKMMVRALHAEGIEVILDVVYNHTAEGNQLGPTLSFRGIDNLAYYRTVTETPRYYMDYTGCGNTLNMRHPRVLQLMMDSLRYWVEEMHVDGFRFDLASALARELFDVDKLSAFFDVIQQDPVISQVKLIAEPWDLGAGGYQVGNFPVLWTEWNGKFRDCVRRFWRGDDGQLGELATRLTGSSDLYQHNGRSPMASINFVTAHDGFTIADLTQYNQKHNHANGEQNRDGESHNLSWNCGVEGPTLDPEIQALRMQQRRNLMTTLLLAVGVPMICAGDEMGRTQWGNNNAYCQDNPMSWLHWDLKPEDNTFLAFTQKLLRLRREQPVFHRRRFFSGEVDPSLKVRDIHWIKPTGKEMVDKDWLTNDRVFGCVMVSAAEPDFVEPGSARLEEKHILLLLFNSYWKETPFVLPAMPDWCEAQTLALQHAEDGLITAATPDAIYWSLLLETSEQIRREGWKPRTSFPLRPRSIAIFSLDSEDATVVERLDYPL